MLDLASRGNARKNFSDQPAGFLAVEIGALAAPQRVEPVVEPALEPIDSQRVEPGETFQTDQLIKPVLAFDHEMQAPLSVPDVEGKEIIHPRGEGPPALRLEFQPAAIRVLEHDTFAHGPGFDDFP